MRVTNDLSPNIYRKTLKAARVMVKVGRKEIEDEKVLGKFLEIYLELEDLLKNGSGKGPN